MNSGEIGHRSTIGSFPAIVSVMQGPTASGTDINQPASLNHVQSAAETRLSDYIGSTSETACLHATNADVQRLSDWNTGESSSTLDLPNQLNNDGLKTEHGWSSSRSAPTEGPEERQLKPDTVIFPFNPDLSLHGNQSSTQPYPLLGSSSTSNLNINIGHIAYTANRGKGTETDGGDDIHNPSGNIEQTSFGSASRDYVGTSSGSSGHMVWQDNANSSSSLINWGSSCKRKALEDSSGVLGTGGSSSSLVVSENNSWPTVPASNASSSLSVTTPSEDVRTANPPLHHNPGNGVWQASSEAFPLVSVVGNVERPLRSFGSSVTQVQHRESLPMNSSSTGSTRHPNNSSLHQVPGSDSFNDSLELRLTAGITAANSGSPQNQSFSLHVPGFSGSMHPFPWHGAANLRGASQQEELNLRIPPRDNSENHMLVPTSSGHDPANWYVSSGNVNNSGAVSSSPWMGSSSSIPSFPNPSWIVTHEVPMQNLHRLSEFSPWSLFPSVAHNGHSTSLPSGHPASGQDTSNHQSFARSTSLMGRRVDDVFSAPNSLRALAFDIEGRRRLINEVLFLLCHPFNRNKYQ